MSHNKNTYRRCCTDFKLPRGISWQNAVPVNTSAGKKLQVNTLGSKRVFNRNISRVQTSFLMLHLQCLQGRSTAEASLSCELCAASEWHQGPTTDTVVSSEGRLHSSVQFWAFTEERVWKEGLKGDICSWSTCLLKLTLTYPASNTTHISIFESCSCSTSSNVNILRLIYFILSEKRRTTSPTNLWFKVKHFQQHNNTKLGSKEFIHTFQTKCCCDIFLL